MFVSTDLWLSSSHRRPRYFCGKHVGYGVEMIEPTSLFVKVRPTPAGEGSVEDHARIAQQHGAVWWGRWTTSTENRQQMIDAISDQILRGLPVWLLIRNATERIEYRARLLQLEPPNFQPPAQLVPAYRNSPSVDMWLKLSNFETLTDQWIANNTVYARGKLEGQPMTYAGNQALRYATITSR